MSDLVFYHNPRSRAQMVHWMLEEVGEPYETRILDMAKGEQKAPEFLKLNPMGKIPTIVHEGTVVTETGAIIAYLADAFPAAGLMPSLGDPARGTVLRWLFFAAGCVEPAMIDQMMHRPPMEPEGASPYGTYDNVLGGLRSAVTPGPWILGDTFSAADVYLGAQLAWVAGFGAPGLKDDPAISAYIARVQARPAYQRTSGAVAG